MRFFGRLLAILVLVGAPVIIAACADSPTAPKVATSSPSARKGFYVCPWGFDGSGQCTSPEYCMDATASSGAFCGSQLPCDIGCGGGGGGGGYVPTIHYDPITTVGEDFPGYDADFYAPERINEFGYILKNVYKHSPVFTINYTCQFGDTHFFYISDGYYNRNNWGVTNLGATGWRGNYALNVQPFVTHIRGATPGETLNWVSRIPITLRLKPIVGNANEVVSFGFEQSGKVQGSFIGIHYR